MKMPTTAVCTALVHVLPFLHLSRLPRSHDHRDGDPDRLPVRRVTWYVLCMSLLADEFRLQAMVVHRLRHMDSPYPARRHHRRQFGLRCLRQGQSAATVSSSTGPLSGPRSVRRGPQTARAQRR